MTDSVTLNYSWSYPTVGADANTWGGTLNTTIIAIDAQVFLAAPKASPTFTGTLTSMGLAITSAGLDTTTIDGQGFGLRIRAGVSGNSILQFTNAAGSSQFATLTSTVAGALTASGGFSGNLIGNVTGNVTGNVSGSSGSCTGNAATATSATTATTATNQSGGSVSATTVGTSGNVTIGGVLSVGGLAKQAGSGSFPHFIDSGNTSGVITVSSSAASGTPGAGDIWLQHS